MLSEETNLNDHFTTETQRTQSGRKAKSPKAKSLKAKSGLSALSFQL